MLALKSKYLLDDESKNVVFSVPDLIVFQDTKTAKHCSFSITDVHKLYCEHRLKPLAHDAILSDAEVSLQYSFLKESQKRELTLKLGLVNAFIGKGVPRGLEARELIEYICKEHCSEKLFGESTVRNWVTQYVDNNYNPLALLDHRRKIPLLV